MCKRVLVCKRVCVLVFSRVLSLRRLRKQINNAPHDRDRDRDRDQPSGEELLYAVFGLLAILAIVLVAASSYSEPSLGR